jgi:hypothetical protein
MKDLGGALLIKVNQIDFRFVFTLRLGLIGTLFFKNKLWKIEKLLTITGRPSLL